jgi:hemoglobin
VLYGGWACIRPGPHDLKPMTMRSSSAAGAERLGPGAAAGVDEAMIQALVPAFYARVRQDPELGPVFEREVDDWDEHLAKLVDFWSSVLLATGRFQGQPMAVHVRVGDIGPQHFARWLALFESTAAQLWPTEAAALVTAKARQIGESLQLGIAVSRGELPARKRGVRGR